MFDVYVKDTGGCLDASGRSGIEDGREATKLGDFENRSGANIQFVSTEARKAPFAARHQAFPSGLLPAATGVAEIKPMLPPQRQIHGPGQHRHRIAPHPREQRSAERDRQERWPELLRQPARARLECREVVLHGKAAAEIASYARKGKYDLIVMGSHGYGAIERLLLGSVVAKVLALCKTPVLLIR